MLPDLGFRGLGPWAWDLAGCPGETVRSVSIGYDVTSRWGEARFCWPDQGSGGRGLSELFVLNTSSSPISCHTALKPSFRGLEYEGFAAARLP